MEFKPFFHRARRFLVTFRYVLYSKLNMNRNRRNPLETNDRYTIYSKINQDFAHAGPRA